MNKKRSFFFIPVLITLILASTTFTGCISDATVFTGPPIPRNITGINNGQILEWNSTKGYFEPGNDDIGGGGSTDWNDLTNVPSGFLDNIDNDTTDTNWNNLTNVPTNLDTDSTDDYSPNVAWYYKTDAETIGTNPQPVNWTSEGREDSAFTHTGTSAEITLNLDGYYLITYDMSAQVSDSGRSHVVWDLQMDTGTGFSTLDGTRALTYHRTSADDEATGSCTCIIDANSGDKIQVIGDSDRSSQITTRPHGCRITLQYLG